MGREPNSLLAPAFTITGEKIEGLIGILYETIKRGGSDVNHGKRHNNSRHNRESH
jgi:hypothetical protein